MTADSAAPEPEKENDMTAVEARVDAVLERFMVAPHPDLAKAIVAALSEESEPGSDLKGRRIAALIDIVQAARRVVAERGGEHEQCGCEPGTGFDCDIACLRVAIASLAEVS